MSAYIATFTNGSRMVVHYQRLTIQEALTRFQEAYYLHISLYPLKEFHSYATGETIKL